MRLSTITFIIFFVVIAASPVYAHGGQDTLTTGEVLTQTLALLGLSLLCGELIFSTFVERAHPHERRGLWIGWALLGVTGILVLTDLAQINGQSVTQFLFNAEYQVVGGATIGVVWGARLVAWLLLGALLLQWPGQQAGALVLGIAVALLSEFSRHPLSVEDTPLLLIADTALQLACAVFLGLMLHSLNAMRQRHPLRLRPLAQWMSAAAVLALIGLFIQQGFPETRLLQVGAAAILCGLIALTYGFRPRFSGLVLAQIGLASAVLVLVNPFMYSRLAPQTTQLDYQVEVNPQMSASLEVYPALVGPNTVYLTLIDSQTGLRVDDATRVDLTLGDQPPLSLVSMGDGVYSAEVTLSAAGPGQATVLVQRPDQPDMTLSFAYKVAGM